MKLRVLLPLSCLAAGALAITLFDKNEQAQPAGGLHASDGMSIGGSDNKSGRDHYEWMRLHDPNTGQIPYHIRLKELAFAATLPGADAGSYKTTQTATWFARGPWNVGGRTRAFAIDATNENILLAGSPSGAMWRSVDAGVTWTRTTALNQYHGVTCIAQDKRPGKTGTWYTGSGEAYGASASGSSASYYLGNGMYKSTDGGLTWNVIPSTCSNTPQTFDNIWDLIWNVQTDSTEKVNDLVFAATYGAVYKSINGGTSWTLARGGGTYSYFTDVMVTPKGIVYATLSSEGSQKGIWRSADKGVTWTSILPSNFPTSYKRMVMGYAPSDENQVYFLANTPGFGQPDTNFQGSIEWNSLWKYKYLSGNGSGTGGSWNNLSSNLPTTGGPFDKFNCQGSYDLVVKVKPNDTAVVYIGGTNLYRSTDGFYTSTKTKFIGGYEEGATLPVVNMYADHHPDQHGIEFLPSNPNVMFSANDGGVFKTMNDTASTVVWTSLNNGYLTTMFYTIALDHAVPGNNIIVAGAQDNGSWFTNNNNLMSPWTMPRGGDGSYCAVADSQKMYYLSIQNGKMMKAKLDGSGNVLNYARIDPLGGKGYQFINPYVLDPNNNNLMYLAGGKRLWRNNDLSGIPLINNWDSITTNWVQWPDTVPAAGSRITAVAVSKNPANRVYYGTDKQKIYRVNNAHTGTPTPIDITSTSFNASGYVSCIAIDPNDADKVLLVFSNYGIYSLWYTTDGGTTWSKVAGNLEQNSFGTGNGPSLRWASILPVNGGNVYLVGGSTGLYAADTLIANGTTWVQQAPGLIGNAVVDMIDTRLSDGQVVVATHAHGIFSANITSKADITRISDLEKTTFEMNAYPNPFSDKVNIAFELKKRTNVNLVICDELGRVVVKLADAVLAQGKHEYTFEPSGRTAGIYYARLQAGESTETRKLLLVR